MRRLMRAVLMVGLAGTTMLAAGADEQAKASGKQFYESQVVPKLAENGCAMCHAVGYLQPNVFVYEELLPFLAMGDSPEKTPIIRKIANLRAIRPDIPTHPGGQRCETIKSEPCSTIFKWWEVEFGDPKKAEGVAQ